MKHKTSITIIILSMFLITQFIGLLVIHAYSPISQTIVNPQTGETEKLSIPQELPFGFSADEEAKPGLFSIIFSFIIAITLISILIRYKWKSAIRIWFFAVTVIALAITLNALLKISFTNSSLISLAIALPFGFLKVFRPSMIIHNATELLIYPGISVIFIPLLNFWTIIILLIIISIYDMWAVWHSGIMQKMAKFQMEELKVFGGFFIPYIPKELKAKIKKLKNSKSKSISKKEKEKNKKIKVNLAILGGGDVVFPLITAGVFLRAFGLIPALLVIAGAFAGLLFLLVSSEKKKFYPAMPFITVGIFLGIIISWLFFM